MIGRREIAANLFEIHLKPATKEYSVNPVFPKGLTGYSWIGKNFTVTSKQLNKTRYYSTCLALNETIYDLTKNNLTNILAFEQNLPSVTVCLPNDKQVTDYLELYIKNYNRPGDLSKYLCEFQVQEFSLDYGSDDLIVNGPMVRIILIL